MEKQVTLGVFLEALGLLDSFLSKLPRNGETQLPIDIRAIGGFALMYHNVRVSAVTADIDSVTSDYPSIVVDLVKEVATELDMVSDWLNNYNVLDNAVDAIAALLQPRWEKSEWHFDNINLYVADLEALLRSKLLAAEDDKITGRAQDYPDLLAICVALGCDTFGEIIEQCEVMGINLMVEYPWNHERLVRDIEVAYRDWERDQPDWGTLVE